MVPAASKAVGSPGKEVVVAAAVDSQLEIAVAAYTLAVLDIVGIVDTAVVAGNLVAVEQEARAPAILLAAAVGELDIHRDRGVEAMEMQSWTGVVKARIGDRLTSWACLSSTTSFDEVLEALSMMDCSPCRPISFLTKWALARDCVTNLSAPKAQTPSGALSRGPPFSLISWPCTSSLQSLLSIHSMCLQ